ncbi:hypothetical protein GW916_08355 [bacterium]|nr:hypothetical protein [bacterium]
MSNRWIAFAFSCFFVSMGCQKNESPSSQPIEGEVQGRPLFSTSKPPETLSAENRLELEDRPLSRDQGDPKKDPEIPIPTPKPSYSYVSSEQDIFFSDHENQTSILTEAGQLTSRVLPPGSLIKVRYQKKMVYDSTTKKAREEISNIIAFETIPLLPGEQVENGHLSISDIDLDTPVTDELHAKSLEARYKVKMRAFQNKPEIIDEDKNLDLQGALRQFHKTICADEGYSKVAYIKKWQAFVNAKPEHLKQVAKNAMYLDATIRTTMYEAQQKSAFKGQHPMMAACQFDIIALSIRNRAHKRYKSYGGHYAGDLLGVATNPQYNIWFKKYVSRNQYRITSCFLHPNIEAIRRKQGDRRISLYRKHRQVYEEAALRFPKVLGLNSTEKPNQDSQYLKNLFAIDMEENHLPISKSRGVFSKNEEEYITNLTHYYHPGGMNKCSVHDYANGRGEKLINGFIKVDKGESVDYFVVSNNKLYVRDEVNGNKLKQSGVVIERIEKIKEEVPLVEVTESSNSDQVVADRGPQSTTEDTTAQEDIESQAEGEVFTPPGGEYWTFRIATKKGYINADNYFGGKAVLYEAGLDSAITARHKKWGCLPRGHFSQCFRGGDLPDNGRRIPISWFDKLILHDYGSSLRQDFGLRGGVKYELSKSSGAGLPIAVQCISDEMKLTSKKYEEEYPSFGGTCDPNIMLVTGVDQFR